MRKYWINRADHSLLTRAAGCCFSEMLCKPQISIRNPQLSYRKHIMVLTLELTSKSPTRPQQNTGSLWGNIRKWWVLTGFSAPHKLQRHLHWWFLTFSDLQWNCNKAERKCGWLRMQAIAWNEWKVSAPHKPLEHSNPNQTKLHGIRKSPGLRG